MRSSKEQIKLREVYRLLKAWIAADDVANTPDELLLKNEKRYGKINRDKIEDNLTKAEIGLREFVDENTWIEK